MTDITVDRIIVYKRIANEVTLLIMIIDMLFVLLLCWTVSSIVVVCVVSVTCGMVVRVHNGSDSKREVVRTVVVPKYIKVCNNITFS